MKIVIISLLLFSSLFAWPIGTTKTMRVIVNSSRVSETATNFVHQLNLSDSIAEIDDMIDNTNNVAICLPDGSTLKPKDIVYVEGKKFLIYWDGAKRTTANDTFYLCFGKLLEVVNSTAAYTNSSVSNYWGIDRFSGSTFYDYAGSNNGTGTSVDTAVGCFGVSATNNDLSDRIECGNATMFTSKTAFTISQCINLPTYNSAAALTFRAFAGPTDYVNINFAQNVLWVGCKEYTQKYTVASLGISINTSYLLTLVYDGSLPNNDKLKLYVNGIFKAHTSSVGTPSISLGDYTAAPLTLGHPSGTMSYVGKIDEIAISSSAISAGTVLDRYRVLYEPSTFYSIGAITAAGSVPPVITVQPEDVTVDENHTATFTLTATGATTYQWKRDPTNPTNVGTSSNSYAFTATLPDSGVRFWCIASNSSEADTSDTVMLHVTDTIIEPIVITVQPQNMLFPYGIYKDTFVYVTSNAEHYKWVMNGEVLATDNDTLTFEAGPHMDGWQMQVKCWTLGNDTVFSNVITLTETDAPPVVTTQPVSDTTTGPVRMFAEYTGDNVQIAWYRLHGTDTLLLSRDSVLQFNASPAMDGDSVIGVLWNITDTVATGKAYIEVVYAIFDSVATSDSLTAYFHGNFLSGTGWTATIGGVALTTGSGSATAQSFISVTPLQVAKKRYTINITDGDYSLSVGFGNASGSVVPKKFKFNWRFGF